MKRFIWSLDQVLKKKKMEKKNEKEELIEKVIEWSQTQFRFPEAGTKVRNQNLPSLQQLKMIFRGEMIPIFQYLMTHLRSER